MLNTPTSFDQSLRELREKISGATLYKIQVSSADRNFLRQVQIIHIYYIDNTDFIAQSSKNKNIFLDSKSRLIFL